MTISTFLAKFSMIYWILAQPTQLGSQMRRFSSGFSNETIASQRLPVMELVSKDALFWTKNVAGCLPTQTPTQKFQNEFLITVSHGIMDILVLFEMIF